ncbi:MAG: sigma-70 family RNA polymerase sigma factor [Bacteroidota bacterium]
MTPAEIIVACQKKDKQAERLLFDQYAPMVYGWCRRYSKDDHEAKDFLQECFLHLFNQIQRYDAQKGVFAAWLHRLCTNTILKLIRKDKHYRQIMFVEQIPETELDEQMLEQVPQEIILRAIRGLPEGYQTIFNLFCFDQWSHEEIAQHLGISSSTSRSQLSRAKKLLKIKLLDLIPNIHERLA